MRREGLGLKAGNDDEAVFSFQYRCDISHPVELKVVSKAIAGEAEKRIIAEVKKKRSLNQIELARYLGIDPKTLWSKMQ